jgi:hypothetical protein
VKALNSLQTNRAFIEELKKEERNCHASQIKKLQETGTFLERYVIVRVIYVESNCR